MVREDIYFLVGFIIFAVGIGMIHIPTAVVVLGVALMMAALLNLAYDSTEVEKEEQRE